ncbi:spermatogenesis-associated protein 20 [Zopfochytrium polystomum]|nr:spermatogenesis-associated protein 20 [Zopfochytrium polystomum]
MTFVQALTGRGGWPMTVMLTPDLKPFFGGNYFPPERKFGSPGYTELLELFGERWRNDSASIVRSSEAVMRDLLKFTAVAASDSDPSSITYRIPQKTFNIFARTFDSEEGGFGRAPKFPTPVIFEFLIRYKILGTVPKSMRDRLHSAESSVQLSTMASELIQSGLLKQWDSVEDMSAEKMKKEFQAAVAETESEGDLSLEMVAFTLEKIARGGIHDHVGSGFHRYSVDGIWHVPHFEKMLYDQAQLLSAFSEMFLITREKFYSDVARDIIGYVSRDLSHADGGFFSAEDADSFPSADATEQREGAFAVWEKQELEKVLGTDAKIFCHHYGVESDGNVDPRHDPHGELAHKNVLFEKYRHDETGSVFEKSAEEVDRILASCRELLWKTRCQRPKPHRDDKVITSWNGWSRLIASSPSNANAATQGLMISSLAKAGRFLPDPSALNLAVKSAEFIHNNLTKPGDSAKLLRTFRGDAASNIDGFADDYAFLMMGLLDLYEATFDIRWLRWAAELQETMDEKYWDGDGGGYFSGPADDKHVLLRLKDDHDGAEPTVNSVAVLNLLRLDSMLPDPADQQYRRKAERILLANIETLARSPRSLPCMSAGLMMFLKGFKSILIYGDENEPFVQEAVQKLSLLPDALTSSIVHISKAQLGANAEWLCARNRTVSSLLETSPGGRPAAYICQDGVCGLPIKSIEGLQNAFA